VIFGIAVIFPIVITFGAAGVLAGRHAQAAVQGFFPWSFTGCRDCINFMQIYQIYQNKMLYY